MFELRGTLSKSQTVILTIAGVILLIGLWWALAEFLAQDKVEFKAARLDDPALGNINRDSLAKADSIAFSHAKVTGKIYKILPTPPQVLESYPILVNHDNLIAHTLHSIWLNIQGYFWAILIAILLGFLIGLIPLFNGLFSKPIEALRYLPISALTGLFILWFGLGDPMKVAFLAFGILVYMIPVVIQRINEVEDVHIKTAYTLGASNSQLIRSVYFPSVFSKFMDDLRVLTAISWTYIIIAEILNNTGGLGSLIYYMGRRDMTAKVFALLILIILIGIVQDRMFVYLDKRLFPHKYYKTKVDGLKEVQLGIWVVFAVIAAAVILPMFGIQSEILPKIAGIVCIACLALILMGEFKLWKSLKTA